MTKTLIRDDFPNRQRLGTPELFRELLGGVAKSTFSRHLMEGTIPQPDVKLGTLNRWHETTMAETIKKLSQKTPAKTADIKAKIKKRAKDRKTEPKSEPTKVTRSDDWHYDSQGYCDNPGRGY